MDSKSLTTFIPPKPLNTAVLFLVFNRLDTTKQVFEAIRQAKPPKLYVASDGARKSREDEEEKVVSVRKYITEHIDWDCEVKTLFRSENLGCKEAVSSAITWFFDNEEMGIILEDDCLPSQSFFWFCEELLEKYKYADDVYVISGDGISSSNVETELSYSFIKYSLIWGWASWNRVWTKYDKEMMDWPKISNNLIKNISSSSRVRMYWNKIFNKAYNNIIDTWDYQLSYLVLKNNAKCIVPHKNLIKNIGFGTDATHTFNENDKMANVEIFDIRIPLKHTENTTINNELNKSMEMERFYSLTIFERALNKLSRMILRKNLL